MGGGNIIRKQLPDFDAFGKIVVEDWAYLGARSMIMPGVTIGEGALVAAGSVVTKSVPSGIVVAGNPAKKICSVDDFISKNLPFNLHTKGISAKEKKRILLSVEDSRLIHK